MSRLWDKGGSLEENILRFTVGDDPDWDERLVEHDIKASIAHAQMLGSQGYLSPEDTDLLCQTLGEIGMDHQNGQWQISLEEEDCHTAIENRLTKQLGELGGRIHLGRSRNDQVLAALRLYLLSAIDSLVSKTVEVNDSLQQVIARWGNLPMPGYTHLQRAMPCSVGLWAGAYRSEMEDNHEGLLSARRRLSLNPLGSAAGYGVPEILSLDREATRHALGFDKTQEPVTAVQLSRGKGEANLVFEILLLMQDLGRLASDLCLFATEEFGYIRLPDSITTGSSIMPQKRNPDVFELVRGRSTQCLGELIQVLSLTVKMPFGYHREMQLIKPPLFRSIDNAEQTLEVMAYALPLVELREDRLNASMSSELYATEKAYELVAKQGLSFREAYRIVGAQYRQKPAQTRSKKEGDGSAE